MTLGTEWDELSFPYGDPRNGETAMNEAADRYRYILERPISGPPGLRWIYNGGTTALLAKLIAQGTGQAFRLSRLGCLFSPLGITSTEWRAGKDGEPLAASGLRLTTRDLARIGVMILQKGQWDAAQIIPEAWLTASFKPAVSIPDGRRFGYHWYLEQVPTDDGAGRPKLEDMICARGNGGRDCSYCRGSISPWR